MFVPEIENWRRLENTKVEKFKPRAATKITELKTLHFAMEGLFVLLKHLTVKFQLFDCSIQKSLKLSRWETIFFPEEDQ